MIDCLAKKTGKGQVTVFSESDAELFDDFYINEPLRVKVTRASKVKTRSYIELSCYKGSCQYIANMNFNENMNTKEKVDHLTKIRCGFVETVIYDDKTKQTHWLVKSLSYKNCDQPESHRYIASALEHHAGLVGISNVDDYVKLLDAQK